MLLWDFLAFFFWTHCKATLMPVRLALEESGQSHGKVRHSVFRAQFTKISSYFGSLHFRQKIPDTKTLSTDNNN